MRTIKFRGKRLDNGEWVSGSLIIEKSEYIADSYRIHVSTPLEVEKCQVYEVSPATVGQYTDVEDCKGVEIYEGDIIRHGELFEICFEDGCFWRRNESDTMELHTIIGMGKIEVVGNIHDNPELLKNE